MKKIKEIADKAGRYGRFRNGKRIQNYSPIGVEGVRM